MFDRLTFDAVVFADKCECTRYVENTIRHTRGTAEKHENEQQATNNTRQHTKRWKRLLLLRLLLAGRRPTLRWEKPPPPPPSGRNRSVTGSVANGPPTIAVVSPTWSRPYKNDERDAWPASGRPWFKSLRGSVVVVVIAVTAVITVIAAALWRWWRHGRRELISPWFSTSRYDDDAW